MSIWMYFIMLYTLYVILYSFEHIDVDLDAVASVAALGIAVLVRLYTYTLYVVALACVRCTLHFIYCIRCRPWCCRLGPPEYLTWVHFIHLAYRPIRLLPRASALRFTAHTAHSILVRIQREA